jgi:hypothetical protein
VHPLMPAATRSHIDERIMGPISRWGLARHHEAWDGRMENVWSESGRTLGEEARNDSMPLESIVSYRIDG